jgi:putative component of toxin-antitoxin plasmid stabilization module
MKYLPFRIILFSILLPPILFILSVESIQTGYIDARLESSVAKEIENIILGDVRPLLNGTARLRNVVDSNVRSYFKKKAFIYMGIKARAAVLTKQGKVLYPYFFDAHNDLIKQDSIQIAAENLELLNEGLVVKVELSLGYNTLLSFLILAFYISVSLAFLYAHYKAGIRRANREAQEKNIEIRRLLKLEKHHTDQLSLLEKDKNSLLDKFSEIKQSLEKERADALRTEDQLVDEIVALEEKIHKNIALQREQWEEIEQFKKQLEAFEKEKKKEGKAGKKEANLIQKRFKALYKQVLIRDRAISGFIDLTDDMRIKAEEMLLLLNFSPEQVTIKRKVFGKKGRQTVLEAVFSYKGRLYFRKTKDKRVEVLTIGTKNSQSRDLEFLNSVGR